MDSAAAAAAAAAAPSAESWKNKSITCNLLYSTTYALNKSNCKRATIGLEYYGGYYRAVLKICANGSPAKYVTLDTNSWEVIKDQMDAMDAYLNHSFTFYQDFGNPSKILLPNHDVTFTNSFGARAIGIDERPTATSAPTAEMTTHNGQQFISSVGGHDEETQQHPPAQPACKKQKKYESPPSVIMHQQTFAGLKQVKECIDLRFKQLEELSGLVNRGVDSILDYIKDALKREEAEVCREILKNVNSFKQYYALHKYKIDEIVKTNLNFATVSVDVLDVVLTEIYAFGLARIAKDVYDVMFPI